MIVSNETQIRIAVRDWWQLRPSQTVVLVPLAFQGQPCEWIAPVVFTEPFPCANLSLRTARDLLHKSKGLGKTLEIQHRRRPSDKVDFNFKKPLVGPRHNPNRDHMFTLPARALNKNPGTSWNHLHMYQKEKKYCIFVFIDLWEWASH